MEDDFDAESLADYLHLSVAQINRLIERGKLPGRRVAGAWKFSRPEIHQWLEERIGLSSDEQLAQVEHALLRSDISSTIEISIAELMPIDAVAVPLAARTRSSVIDSMCSLAASTGYLWDERQMAAAVRSREEMASTALENGIALLHPRRPLPAILGQALIAFGRTESGIPFGGGRSRLTDLYFLICSIDDTGHLRTLARLTRLIGDAGLVAELRSASDARALLTAIREYEERA